MSISDILLFSAKNVYLNGKKTILSVLAIAVGIFSVTLISAGGDLAASEIETRISETGLGGITIFPSKSGSAEISEQELSDVRQNIKGIRGITPFTIQNTMLSHRGKSRTAALIGVNEEIAEVFELQLLHGRFFTKADMLFTENTPIGIVIDDVLAQILYERSNIVGKTVTLSIGGMKTEGEVIGVIRSQKRGLESMLGLSLPNMIYVPYTALLHTDSNSAGQIAISCFGGYDENHIARQTAQYLTAINQTTYKFENLNQYISGLKEIMEILQMFLKAVAAISLLVGSLGIMNCMLYIVDARRTEIGICKALGETRHSILIRHVVESMLICLLGSCGGIIALYCTTGFLQAITGITLQVSIQNLFQSACLTLICGILSGLIPAYNAANLEPIEVIRQ